VLAAQMLTGVGFEDFPVYSYTKDTSTSSTCNGSCAAAWPALITDGTPGLIKPLSSSQVGSITRSDGTTQLTFDKKPLYLYSLEGIAPKGSSYAATGNGNGLKTNGGTFQLVTP
jgi:predicted lipoprotein with Yx(FWY)xxD motif